MNLRRFRLPSLLCLGFAALTLFSASESFAGVTLVSVTVEPRPDLRLGESGAVGKHAGNDNYSRVRFSERNLKKKATFFASIENDSADPDTIIGSSKKSRTFSVKYLASGQGNVTSAFTSGRYTVDLPSGAIQRVKIRVSPKKRSTRSQTFKDTIMIQSQQDASANDTGVVKLKFLGSGAASGSGLNSSNVDGPIVP